MYKEIAKAVDKFVDKIKGVEKLTKKQKRGITRKLIRKGYIKQNIRHFGNFAPVKPLRH